MCKSITLTSPKAESTSLLSRMLFTSCASIFCVLVSANRPKSQGQQSSGAVSHLIWLQIQIDSICPGREDGVHGGLILRQRLVQIHGWFGWFAVSLGPDQLLESQISGTCRLQQRTFDPGIVESRARQDAVEQSPANQDEIFRKGKTRLIFESSDVLPTVPQSGAIIPCSRRPPRAVEGTKQLLWPVCGKSLPC